MTMIAFPARRATPFAALLLAFVFAHGIAIAQGTSSDSRSATRQAPEAGSTPGRAPVQESSPGRSGEGRSTQGAASDTRSAEGRSGADTRSTTRERDTERRSRTPAN